MKKTEEMTSAYLPKGTARSSSYYSTNDFTGRQKEGTKIPAFLAREFVNKIDPRHALVIWKMQIRFTRTTTIVVTRLRYKDVGEKYTNFSQKLNE